MKIVDLFCGAGGFSTGFEQSGHTSVVAVDFNEKALKAYEKNHPDTPTLLLELGTDDDSELREIIKSEKPDGVIGGPPCPNFSIANNNRDIEEGMRLVHEFYKIIEYVREVSDLKFHVGENVPHASKFIQSFYPQYMYKKLNSMYYGVPQKRERVFFGDYSVPTYTHGKYKTMNLDGDEILPFNTVSDILEDGLEWKSFDELPKNAQKRVSDYEFQFNKGHRHSRIQMPDVPSMTITAHHDTKKMLLVSNSNSNGKQYKDTNKPSFTVTTTLDMIVANPNNYKFRKLSELEMKRLMGFPDDYIFVGGRNDRMRQIGNAVCPPVAKAIGDMLR